MNTTRMASRSLVFVIMFGVLAGMGANLLESTVFAGISAWIVDGAWKQ